MQDFNILDLIPQRPPIVMVDKLIDVGAEFATTTFRIEESNIFNNNGFLQESGLVENIAQTAAAMTGYAAKVAQEKVKIGYIGAVKNLIIHSLPPIDAEIQTTVKVTNVVLDITIINGLISFNNSIIAECEMRIFIQE